MDGKQWDEYAQDYHEYIISPLADDVRNPLFSELEKLDPQNVVADLGTGRGELLPILSDKFREVYAIDFSQGMLRKARKKSAPNVTLIKKDMRRLTELDINFDLAISVNSILHPNPKVVDDMLQEIFYSLNPGGRLKAVFPSMESILYYFQLVYERELERFDDEKKALAMTRKKVARKCYNIITCTYDDGDVQKLFYKFELKSRLKKAGFKSIKVKKVYYPWGDAVGDFEDFFGKPRMWDWYVSAKK